MYTHQFQVGNRYWRVSTSDFWYLCCHLIENDGQDEWVEGLPLKRDWQTMDADTVRKIIREAGIVGMGGATFPTHVKMAPPRLKIDVFILNAVECEPYLTADHRMMLEEGDRIVTGVKIMMKTLGVTKGIVGIEDNKKGLN